VWTSAFDNGFANFYVAQGRTAGTYTYSDNQWSLD
jgi:hypothetical protein